MTLKYGARIDRESAAELLAARVERAAEAEEEAQQGAPKPAPRRKKTKPKAPTDPLTDFLSSRRGKAIQRDVVRGVFGMLKKRL